MRKTKLLMACLMSASIVAVATGCKPEVNDSVDHLEIKVYEAGYGVECISAVAERFMELNEGKTISISTSTDGAALRTDIPAGPSINTTDIYLAGSSFYDLITLGAFTVDGVTYDNRFMPLDDVYNSPAYGETVLIKDKMNPSFERENYCDDEYMAKYNLKGHYYTAPWMGGIDGIAYNATMFEKYGWEVPVTTDEMLALCDQILATKAYSTNKNSVGKEIKISPFVYSKEDSYWSNIILEWRAQYDGIDTFRNFFQGLNAKGEYNADLVTSQGVLASMKVLDSLIGTYNADGSAREKVYTDPNLASRTYIDTQATFLNAEGARVNDLGSTTAAMMPIGDWIENEMYSNYGDKLASGELAVKMMKTPIISAITDKLSFKGDDKLSELVKWIDGGKQGAQPTFATDADVETVEAARNMAGSSTGNGHVILVPAYTSSPELVKEFLRFFYSDEGITIFSNAGHGVDLPLNFDYSTIENASTLQKSKFEILSSTTRVIRSAKHPITFRANLMPYVNITSMGSLESMFNVSSQRDYRTPEDIFQKNYQEVARRWATMMEDAGLN